MLKLLAFAVFVAAAQASLKCSIQLRVDCDKFGDKPVCGDDSASRKTYKNACEMDTMGCKLNKVIKMVFNGPCENSTKPECEADYIEKNFQCDENDPPLCATNGQTYKNKCEFQKAKCDAYEKYGPIRAPQLHIRVMGRGCNNTPRPYNPCQNKWREADCESYPTTIFSKYCDTTGQVYRNRCYFMKAQCVDKSIKQTWCRPSGL